jgi:hypothetical protein
MMWQLEHDTYLERLHGHLQFDEVIVGSNVRDKQGRRLGEDAHAKGWADRVGIDTTVMDANWVGHGRGGGPRRNARMLRSLHFLCTDTWPYPGLVLAFPGGDGTDDLCRQASACHVRVLRYPEYPPEWTGKAA